MKVSMHRVSSEQILKCHLSANISSWSRKSSQKTHLTMSVFATMPVNSSNESLPSLRGLQP